MKTSLNLHESQNIIRIHLSKSDCTYPLLMIMGFIFMTMEFIEGVGYRLKQIHQCCFPNTKKAINGGVSNPQ